RVFEERFDSPPTLNLVELPEEPQRITIRFGETVRHVEVPRGKTILDAGLDGGAPLPHRCMIGDCGSCAVRVQSGEAWSRSDGPLSQRERERGMILACMSHPLSKMEIESPSMRAPSPLTLLRMRGFTRLNRTSCSALGLHHAESRVGLYLIALLPAHPSDRRRLLRHDAMLHLHGFHHGERRAGLDLLVDRGEELNDLARHRREIAALDALRACLGKARQLTEHEGVA